MKMNNKLSHWDKLFQMQLSDEQMISILDFFYPRFIERDDCVFLLEQLEAFDLNALKEKYKNQRTQIEEVVNSVDFTDIINSHLPNNDFESLVQQIAHLWKLRLKEIFPNRKFNVQVSDFSGDGAWGIIVSQDRE
jgi:hypothetical protein